MMPFLLFYALTYARYPEDALHNTFKFNRLWKMLAGVSDGKNFEILGG